MTPRARLMVATALALLAFPTAASATINVANNLDNGPGSLRQAISDASPGETINVPAETITLSTGELVINKNLVIAGAGAGSTIISGGNASSVILVMGSSTLDLSGVTLRDGLLVNPAGVSKGAALSAGTGAVTISHSSVTANRVDTNGGPGQPGGVIYGGAIATDGALTLTDSVVSGNTALANGATGQNGGVIFGGGMEVGGALTLTNVQVNGNTVHADGGAGSNAGVIYGGGIDAGSTITATNVQVNGNVATTDGGSGSNGGVVYGAGAYAATGGTISGASFSSNAATARGGSGPSNASQNGGVIYGGGADFGGALSLSDSSANSNSIDASGGAGAAGGVTYGGGISYTGGSSVDGSITNATIAGNTATVTAGGAEFGGGVSFIHSGTGNFLLADDTIADNALVPGLSSGGGNLYSSSSGGGVVQARNTLVSGGAALAGTENCSIHPAFASLGHNLDSLDQCGFNAAGDKVNADPGLGPLQDNGGPGTTLSFGLTSPAFDAGDPATCPATDERGVKRPQGAGCDIGALELELADLGLRNSARSASLRLGQTVIFDLAASNGGSGTGHGTTITERLPAGLALVSATPSSGTCSGSKTVSCNLGEFFPGQAGGVTLVARATRSGTQTASASIGSSTTDPSAGNNSAATSVKVARLALSSVSVAPRTFHLGSLLPKLSKAKVGTTIRFSLPERATVKLAFAKPAGGRKSGRRCAKPSPRNRHGKACTRFVSAGSLSLRAHAGGNKLRFQGRLSRRKRLAPGRYRLTLTAKDGFGNRSKPVAIRIRALPA